MEEQLVTYSTATISKEKGFDLKVYDFYLEDKKSLYIDGDIFEKENHNIFNDVISAPTQSLLQKWLRDVHNIHINPIRNNDNTYLVSVNGFWLEEEGGGNFMDFENYEMALESGLISGLYLIIFF